MPPNKAYINHYNCICSAGNTAEELFQNILLGKSGVKTDTTYFEGKKVGIGKVNGVVLQERLLTQVEEILQKSSLDDFKETLLLIGSSVGGMSLTENIFFQENSFKNVDPKLHVIDAIAHKIRQKFTFKDNLSFSTACTSSANALGYGYEVITKGIFKNVLVIGFDTLCQTTVGGFNALGVLSERTCIPFDSKRNGMNVAEASALLLLQDFQTQTSVELCGVGYSSDAHHMTQPSPSGLGAITAMQKALTCKEITPEDVQYINAHGTGTVANDSSEMVAIKTLFNNYPYVSSTKSITGHTLGAAGALEAIISVMALEKQTLPPNLGLTEPEVERINFVLEPKKEAIRYALSNSFAFGGNNTSLLFGYVQ